MNCVIGNFWDISPDCRLTCITRDWGLDLKRLHLLLCPTMTVLWGLFFFMARHDVLLCFLIWRKRFQTVCAMLDAALRTFTEFAHVVRLLRTYTAFAFSHVVRRLCTYIALVFTMFNVENFKESDLQGSVGFFCPCKLIMILYPNSLEVSLVVLI